MIFIIFFSFYKNKKDDENEQHAIDSETEPSNWFITGMFQVGAANPSQQNFLKNLREYTRKCTASAHGIP